jgi:CheY-like chemotaxis protein
MKKIIIIDDDATNNFLCETMIRKLLKDVEVITFLDPMQAFEYLKNHHQGFQGLVIIDVNMPELSGWELLNMLKENNIIVPVIMLTSSISDQDKVTASEITMVHQFLVKPIDPGMIIGLGDFIN